MSRILVVEPYRLLQFAFAVALCPDHELLIVKTIPETVEGVDLALVDAPALRDRDLLSRADFELIRNWRLPVVWLETDGAESPKVGRLKRVKLPLDRETLKQALIALQTSSEMPATWDSPMQADGRAVKKPRPKQAKAEGVVGEPNRKVVELVDVVEETADEAVKWHR
jgi:hypothetical protein